jgi:hypothetical protein
VNFYKSCGDFIDNEHGAAILRNLFVEVWQFKIVLNQQIGFCFSYQHITYKNTNYQMKCKLKSILFCGATGVLSFISSASLFAQSGKVLVLDGSTQYMKVATAAALNVESGQSLTITLKVKSTSAANDARYFAKRAASSGVNQSTPGVGGTGYEAFLNSGKVGPNARTTASGSVGGGYNSITTLNNGAWHHIAMVFDHSTVSGKYYTRLSVDGTITSSTEVNAASLANLVEFVVGAASDYSRKFAGQIDDIRVYDKALSTTEIEADRNLASVSNATPNLSSAWDFENVSGTTVSNTIGIGNNGTLVGNPNILDISSNIMQYVSASIIQTELPSAKGLTNQRVIATKISTTGQLSPINLTALNFTMNGTTAISDVNSIKIYYTGASNRFDTNNLFATVTPASGNLVANGTQALVEGDNYFFICYDVKSSANEGNLLDATCEAVTVGGNLRNIATNSPSGSRVVLLENTLLVKPGDAGSVSYRIPALTTAKDGSLVAVVDKRWNHSGDLAAKIDPIAFRSTDGGRTWSAPVVLANFGGPNGAGDAAIVTDRNTGDIVVLLAATRGLWSSTNANPIDIQVVRSTDNGVTWTAPVTITSQIYSPTLNPGWRGLFVASGQMHQLRNGNLVAAIAVREDLGGGEKLNNYLITSTDGGHNWTASTGCAEFSGDEAKVVELNNGDLMMSIRNAGKRRKNISTDKGLTWGTAVDINDITDPNCDGDFIRYTSTLDGYDKNRLLHSIPFAGNRSNVSVLLSTDEGMTWPVRKTIFSGSSAYSSLSILPDGTIGIFYENGENGAVFDMYFCRFSLSWLTNGADVYTPSPLPVKLSDFGANFNQASSAVHVKWQTQSEVNVKHFELEYASDGVNFSKVASVKPKANNGFGSVNYTYSFNPVHSGTLYLRLKIVDLDGKFAYSKVISRHVELSRQFIVSPNPVSDNLTIQFTPAKGSAQVKISDSKGELIKSIRSNRSPINLDLSNLPKGVYLVDITQNQVSTVQKIIKN